MKLGDIALLDNEEVILLVDIKSAKEALNDRYEVDDEGGHIWLGGDNVVPCTDILAQICSNRGLEWIHLDRLQEIEQ